MLTYVSHYRTVWFIHAVIFSRLCNVPFPVTMAANLPYNKRDTFLVGNYHVQGYNDKKNRSFVLPLIGELSLTFCYMHTGQ